MATEGGNLFKLTDLKDFAFVVEDNHITMSSKGRNIFSEVTDLTDFALVVEDKRLYVNRGVLAVTSPVFGRMLYGDFKEKSATEIPLPGKKYDDILEFLMCVYPSTMKSVSLDNLDILLPLADEYQVDPLKKRCGAFIVNMVRKRQPDVKELVHLLVLGGKYRLENCINRCVRIASRRTFSDMKAMEEFADISSDVKYQLTSLQLERYENGVEELTEYLQCEDLDFDYCDHPSKYLEKTEYCTKCKDQFIPNILKRIKKFESKSECDDFVW